MLASPLPPAPTFGLQPREDDFRPSKDIETFNSLLPPPIEFVEGSSTGAYAVPEGKYKPINAISSHKPAPVEVSLTTTRFLGLGTFIDVNVMLRHHQNLLFNDLQHPSPPQSLTVLKLLTNPSTRRASTSPGLPTSALWDQDYTISGTHAF